MSYRPNALGFFLPTGGSLPLAFPWYQAYSPRSATLSPKLYAVVVLARHAYSHSASLGRRMTSLALIRFSLRNRAVSLVQKVFASSQVIFSTELRGPFHRLGFLPMTCSYSSCVTSYLAIAKGALSVTLTVGFSDGAAPSPGVPIVKLAGNLPLPGVSWTSSSANRRRTRVPLSSCLSSAGATKGVSGRRERSASAV